MSSTHIWKWTSHKSLDQGVNCTTIFFFLTLTDVQKCIFRWFRSHIKAKCSWPSLSWKLQLTSVYFLSLGSCTPPTVLCCFSERPCWVLEGVSSSHRWNLLLCPQFAKLSAFCSLTNTKYSTQTEVDCLFPFILSSIYLTTFYLRVALGMQVFVCFIRSMFTTDWTLRGFKSKVSVLHFFSKDSSLPNMWLLFANPRMTNLFVKPP